MGFFDDYQAAIESYPTDYITLEIVNLALYSSDGDVLNEGDRGSFDVRVTNRGPLRIDDLTVKIRGRHGVLVKDAGAAAPYVSEFVTSVGQFEQIAAHNGNNPDENIGGFGFEATQTTTSERNLIVVSIEEWNPDLLHLWNAHSDPVPSVKGVYRDRVRAA